MRAQEHYFLKVGREGKPRLDILNRLYNHSTQEFALRSGLKKGMAVLEAGCGNGEMSCWLASTVGPSGRVTTLDQSSQQLALVKERAVASGIQNLNLLQAQVYDASDLGGVLISSFAGGYYCTLLILLLP